MNTITRFSVNGLIFNPVRLPSRPLPRENPDSFLPWICGRKGQKGAVLVERVGIGGRYELFFGQVFLDVTPEFLATLLRKGYQPKCPLRLADTSPATLAGLLG